MNLEQFYEDVGEKNGWDFSKLQVMFEGIAWDFHQEVKKRLQQSDLLLDIGTGGGENLLTLAPFCHLLIGIDLALGMIQTARANLEKQSLTNAKFFQIADHLHFPTGFFDIVTSRHAPFIATEVARVVKQDGYFLTQQVGEKDKLNIKKAFGRGQAVDVASGTLKNRYEKALQAAGYSNIETLEYDAAEYYQRPEDLIFLLKHTPIIPDFGQEDRDFAVLEQFMKDNQTGQGFKTNANRILMIAKK